MDALGSQGGSESWHGQKKNVVRIFDVKFRTSTPELRAEYPQPWAATQEWKLCERPVYERYSHFLLFTYKIETGENVGAPLSCDSVVNYTSALLNLAKDKFKAIGSNATRTFFNCLDGGSSDEAKWWHGLKENIRRVAFERAKEAGEQIDKSESTPPLAAAALAAFRFLGPLAAAHCCLLSVCGA
jgi:hypothetical protein